jgi:hypothetical protein
MNSYPLSPKEKGEKGKKISSTLTKRKKIMVNVQQPQNPWELWQMKLYKNNAACRLPIGASMDIEIHFSRSVALSRIYIFTY